jgi:hypothetical protein
VTGVMVFFLLDFLIRLEDFMSEQNIIFSQRLAEPSGIAPFRDKAGCSSLVMKGLQLLSCLA